LLYAMKSSTTDEAAPGTEEKICIVRWEAGENIEGKAIYSNRYGSREDGTFIEHKPVGVMIVRHGLLNYLNPFHWPFPLYPRICQRSVTSDIWSDKGQDRWSYRDKCGIGKDNWGQHGMPQDRLQPDTGNPITSELHP
jgi:hypothetical protein